MRKAPPQGAIEAAQWTARPSLACNLVSFQARVLLTATA